MKFFLSIILLLPVAVFSQEINISGYSGICHNKISANFIAPGAPKNSFVGALKVSAKHRSMEFGLGVEAQHVQEQYVKQSGEDFANPLVVPYFFVNKMEFIEHGYFYGGVMAGPAFARVGEMDYNPISSASPSITYRNAHGYAAGLQCGYVYNAAKQLGIGIEAAIRYTQIGGHVSLANYSLFSFPLALGVRWRI